MALAPDSPRPLPEGTRIGPWRLEGHIKSGAFGRVYRAVHAEEAESPTYALKLARRVGDGRYEREAAMLSRLKHLGVVRLHSGGVYQDEKGRPFPYVVMHYIHGEDLYDWGQRRRLSSRQVLYQMGQVARALEETHRHGFHRDVKGDNVRVSPGGHATLLDFGACWFAGARPLTDTAVPPGTEPYRSHQLLRFRYEHRYKEGARYEFRPEDDLYALGVTAYYLVTGGYPAVGTDPESRGDPLREPPERLRPPRERATVHVRLEQIILRLLSEEPERRGRARELAEELEQAVASLGAEADEPIVVTEAYERTRSASQVGPPPGRWERWWRKVRGTVQVVVASTTLVAVLTLVPTVLKAVFGGEETLEGESVGLGNTAMVSPSPAPAEGGRSRRAVSLKVPDGPLRGQKRPPCEDGQVEINKGCWGRTADAQPPCGGHWYEWKEGCYWPIIVSEPFPTSEDP